MLTLYDDQTPVVDQLRKELKTHDIVLVNAVTSFGKTKVSQFIIEKIIAKGFKCLFTTPRIKLATQTQKSFGFGSLILGSKTVDNKSNCTIASVQSLYSRKVTEHFDFVFIDEAHYAHGSEYLNYIFETYKGSKIIGLTGTPIDENGYLLSGYQAIVNGTSVNELIKIGRLTPIEVFTTKNQPDFSKVPITNGDYNQEQAGKILQEESVLSNTVEEWSRLANEMKTITFVSSIQQAEMYYNRFADLGVEVSRVHSKMKEKDIEQAYLDFHEDRCQMLINVDMATFGFDEPSIECMLFARGIKSLRLYKQMVGRGLRIFPGKTKCLMIDCANVIFDNGFPTDEIKLIKKPIINNTIDSLIKVERDTSGEVDETIISVERIEYLEKIGSLVDLYSGKIYKKEQDMVDDCKKLLKRAGFFMWRQNSGMAFMENRWVHFTDVKGLPDITLIYKSVYIGLELKMPTGKLTKHQKETLPALICNRICVFIIENIIDLFQVLEVIQNNIIDTSEGTVIKNELFQLSEQQQKYRDKYKLNQE